MFGCFIQPISLVQRRSFFWQVIMDKNELFDKTEKCDIIRKLENKKI